MIYFSSIQKLFTVIEMKNVLSFILSVLSVLIPLNFEITKKEQPEQLIVIMYHHLSEKSSLLNDYVITPNEFESDLKYLKNNGYKSVTTAQIKNGNIPEKAVLITFDDGFLSNYKYAKPLLEKYNMTAVCAVIGSLMVEYTENPNTISDCAYMDINTVNEMLTSGVFEIASHTYDMHKFDTRKGCSKMKNESETDYTSVLIKDLTEFNNLYFNSFNSTTDIIAFPYGEYSNLTVNIAQENGYKIMLTCEEKINTLVKNNNSPIILGRFNRPHGKSSEEFFAHISESKK